MQYENSITKIPTSVVLIGFFQIIFLIITIPIIISNINQKPQSVNPNSQPVISIDNLTSYDLGLSDYHMRNIAHTLTEAIEVNAANLDIPNTKAIIRNDTLATQDFSILNFKTLSFIVDIPNLEQSYQVYYNYPIDQDLVTFFSEDTDAPFPDVLHSALCVNEPSQIIYPDFDCRSIYPTDARYQIAQSYINLLEFNDFSTNIDDTNQYQINLKPFPKSAANLDESNISQVKHAISSLGISPDMFTYHIIPRS